MKLKEGFAQTFQAPVSVHATQGSHVYMFSNDKSDSDDLSEDEFDVMKLRARRKDRRQPNNSRERIGDVVLLEREITEDDNLNKLALQYGCKVADIKRVNNFIREQDIYALKYIKIPVKSNGILTEGRDELKPLQTVASRSGLTVIEFPEGEASTAGGDPAEYFKEIDQKIEAVVQSTEQSSTFFPSHLLTNFSPGSFRTERPNSGADCGIRWWNAVLFMLLIGIVLPVFYIFYFKTQESKGGNETSHTTGALSTQDTAHLGLNTTLADLTNAGHRGRLWSSAPSAGGAGS